MASIQYPPPGHGGKLVALEGDVDIVKTQLRLLPPSQKILVLPSSFDNFPQNAGAQSFNARAFIRDVHADFVERTERARSFLRSSTATQPRLVFMNGGSVGARTACITRICENITNGEVRDAEAIFNEVVKDGVAGLMRDEDTAEAEEETDGDDEEDHMDMDGEGLQEAPKKVENPSSKAMNAADSLDRETVDLQEQWVETNNAGPNENPKSVLSETPEVMKNSLGSETRDDIIRTVVTVPSETERRTRGKLSAFGSRYPSSPSRPSTSTAHITVAFLQQMEDEYGDDYDGDCAPNMTSPGDGSFFSVPPTPSVVYGEARVVDLLNTTPMKKIRRVKSVDRYYPNRSGYVDWNSGSHGVVKRAKSAYHLGRPSTSSSRLQEDQQYGGFQTLPRTTFVRASSTLIKKSSVSSDSKSLSASTPKTRAYVDCGTDAEDIPIEEAPEESASFEPVFPVAEDLVIHFARDDPCDIFSHVLSAYKNGSYPILPSLQFGSSSVPASSSSINIEGPIIRPTSHLTTETDDDGFHRRHEFDPYASNNYPGGANHWPLTHAREDTPGGNLIYPSPSLTPPPSARGIPEKFCEFSPLNPSNVISIQNSLRSLLNLHFPAGENGYSQYHYPVSPETQRLWKPVFRNEESSSIENEGRTVDQIIALGCEEGVKKELFSQVSGQIEKLGMRRDGLNRSSKIDLRYFIANVMQTQSNLPLSIGSSFSHLSNPEVLATCIVPQIEAYLAINSSTRILVLHYPLNHLATIIALRKIIGQDLLKIAGIMDSTSSDPPSAVSRPRTPKANPLSNEAISKRSLVAHSHSRDSSLKKTFVTSQVSLKNHQSKKSEVSFSKANYLLPSMATNAEISSFLSGIWTGLREISAFYNPELEPKSPTFEKPSLPPTPVTSTFQRDPPHSPASPRHGSTSRESKIARLTGNSGPVSPPSRTPNGYKSHKYAPSITSTVRTTNSERVRREDTRIEKEWENFYIGEEDSEDDDYDRMVMGRSMARIVPEVKVVTLEGKLPKRSTKKALKWLGLA